MYTRWASVCLSRCACVLRRTYRNRAKCCRDGDRKNLSASTFSTVARSSARVACARPPTHAHTHERGQEMRLRTRWACVPWAHLERPVEAIDDDDVSNEAKGQAGGESPPQAGQAEPCGKTQRDGQGQRHDRIGDKGHDGADPLPPRATQDARRQLPNACTHAAPKQASVHRVHT
jgi:hypothetical protein